MKKMAELKKLSLAIFETPERCGDCPCAYFPEGIFSEDYCQLKAYYDPNIYYGEWGIKSGNAPIPDWCPLKPVVFDEDYAK